MANFKYGMIKNGAIESMFESDKPTSAYPDIAHLLKVIPSNAGCGWIDNGDGTFSAPAPPSKEVGPDILDAYKGLVSIGVITQKNMDDAVATLKNA